MNTLYSTARDAGDRLATDEVVWEYVCAIDPPPNGDGWNTEWYDRAEARRVELFEETDLLHLPPDLMDRLDAMVDRRKAWRKAA